MKDKYGIRAHGMPKDKPYQSSFSELEPAKTSARAIAAEHNIEVIVFEILGAYVPTIRWDEPK